MTGSYLLNGSRIGKVILHLFEDRLEVKLTNGEEVHADPADLVEDLKSEHKRLTKDPSPLAGHVNFIETVFDKLGISLHPSVPSAPLVHLPPDALVGSAPDAVASEGVDPTVGEGQVAGTDPSMMPDKHFDRQLPDPDVDLARAESEGMVGNGHDEVFGMVPPNLRDQQLGQSSEKKPTPINEDPRFKSLRESGLLVQSKPDEQGSAPPREDPIIVVDMTRDDQEAEQTNSPKE